MAIDRKSISIAPIAYEDESLLVLNKPSGLPSVPLLAGETGTAVEFALNFYPKLQGIGTRPLEPGLLHRLDTGTSGLLVFAKTQSEFDRLKKVWKEREIRKVYRALVSPAENPSQAGPWPRTIAFALGHSAKSKKRMLVFLPDKRPPKIRGKKLEAITEILAARAVQPAQAPAPGQVNQHPCLDLTIEIKTGVMHQIRAHLAAIGAPIIGDPIYGETPYRPGGEAHGTTRLWLHAWRLEIPKSDGEVLQLEAHMPEGWPEGRPEGWPQS